MRFDIKAAVTKTGAQKRYESLCRHRNCSLLQSFDNKLGRIMRVISQDTQQNREI